MLSSRIRPFFPLPYTTNKHSSEEREWTLEGTVKRTPRLLEVDPETNEVIEITERIITHDRAAEIIEITKDVEAEIDAVAQSLTQMFAKPSNKPASTGSLFELITEPPSPYPWIDDLLSRQRTYSLHRGWAAYRVIEQLQENQDPDLDALQYVGRKVGYHLGWARHAWEDLKAAIESMKEAQWAIDEPEFEDLEDADEVEELASESELIIESILSSKLISLEVKRLFEQERKNLDLTLIYPLLDCDPTHLKIHLTTFTPGVTERWFHSMVEHCQSIEEVINQEVNQWIYISFSCQYFSPPTVPYCPICRSSEFHLHPGKSPHYAKIMCCNQHFVQWLSKIKIYGFEQQSFLNQSY